MGAAIGGMSSEVTEVIELIVVTFGGIVVEIKTKDAVVFFCNVVEDMVCC
jgi:hypothetical protein